EAQRSNLRKTRPLQPEDRRQSRRKEAVGQTFRGIEQGQLGEGAAAHARAGHTSLNNTLASVLACGYGASMTVTLLYFGGLRDRCGVTEETVAVPAPPTVAGLKHTLGSRFPFL